MDTHWHLQQRHSNGRINILDELTTTVSILRRIQVSQKFGCYTISRLLVSDAIRFQWIKPAALMSNFAVGSIVSWILREYNSIRATALVGPPLREPKTHRFSNSSTQIISNEKTPPIRLDRSFRKYSRCR